MPVVPAALGEGLCVSRVARRVEHLAGRAVTGHAVAAQVGEMRGKRRAPWTMPDDSRLDHDNAGAGGETAQRAEARGTTPSETAAALAARPPSMQPAGLLRRRKHSRDEAPSPCRPLRADAARSDVEFVVTRHGRKATR